MKQLIGSAKQIAWAEKIREEKMPFLMSLVSTIEKYMTSKNLDELKIENRELFDLISDGEGGALEFSDEDLLKTIELIQKLLDTDSAETWIELRTIDIDDHYDETNNPKKLYYMAKRLRGKSSGSPMLSNKCASYLMYLTGVRPYP